MIKNKKQDIEIKNIIQYQNKKNYNHCLFNGLIIIKTM